jgi:hypothetical protein
MVKLGPAPRRNEGTCQPSVTLAVFEVNESFVMAPIWSHRLGDSLVNHVDRSVGYRTLHGKQGLVERRGRQSNVGIVGETEAFFGPANKVAVKLHVAIFIVQGNDGVISGWNVVEGHGCIVCVGLDRRGIVLHGLVHILGPSRWRREEQNSYDAMGVAEIVDVNVQNTSLSGGCWVLREAVSRE